MSRMGPIKRLGKVSYMFVRGDRTNQLTVTSSNGNYLLCGQELLVGVTTIYECTRRTRLNDQFNFHLEFSRELEGVDYQLWLNAKTAALRDQHLPRGLKGKPWNKLETRNCSQLDIE